VAGEIKIGTCSWTDPTLTESGAFYPKVKMSAEERLTFYAENFPIVEVDSTFYAPPSERVAGLWVEAHPMVVTAEQQKALSLPEQHRQREAMKAQVLWATFEQALTRLPAGHRILVPAACPA